MREIAQAIRDGAGVSETLATARAALQSAGFRIDYLEMAEPLSLDRLESADGACRLFAAAWLGETRLIDNCPVRDA
jgi:pantoate--beta-alanine ligase